MCPLSTFSVLRGVAAGTPSLDILPGGGIFNRAVPDAPGELRFGRQEHRARHRPRVMRQGGNSPRRWCLPGAVAPKSKSRPAMTEGGGATMCHLTGSVKKARAAGVAARPCSRGRGAAGAIRQGGCAPCRLYRIRTRMTPLVAARARAVSSLGQAAISMSV